MARKAIKTALESSETLDMVMIERMARVETLILTIIEDMGFMRKSNDDVVKLTLKLQELFKKVDDLESKLEDLKKKIENFEIKSDNFVKLDDSSYYRKHKNGFEKDNIEDKKRKLNYWHTLLALVLSLGAILNILAPMIRHYLHI